EDSLLQKDWDLTSRLFPRTRDLKHLQVWEHPIALEAELVLTLPHPSVPSPISHTTLSCARVQAQPTAGCRPQGRFQHWLHQLQEAPEKVSDPGRG
ncbi:hypothetical protein G4228_002248, partial [Cervus hanglu yarkandensis]